MFKKLLPIILFFLCSSPLLFGQTKKAFTAQLDSLIGTMEVRPFNGSIVISQEGKIVYQKKYGFANKETRNAILPDNQFIVGSLSKQITAVLVLREYQKGRIDLHAPIRKYLPKLKESWADSITTHQLLNHTSGVTGFGHSLAFKAGTGFSYSNTGYALLGQIASAVAKKSYRKLVTDLFKRCKMKHSAFPSNKNTQNLLEGYSRQPNGVIDTEKLVIDDVFTPAAGLMTRPEDLVLWNENLHNGKLLVDSVYKRMITPTTVRNHPIFGEVPYGYGVQMAVKDGIYEIGHGGYAPGFVSINFYYPKSKLSLVVSENLDWQGNDIKQAFFFETQIRELVRNSYLVLKCAVQ